MADYMQAPRRNALLGVLADATRAVDDYAQRPDSTMPMGKANALLSVLSRFAGVPAVASTLDRLSYGDSLTTGTGQTLRMRPEVVEAAMAAAPVVSYAGKMAGRGANALADASVRAITRNPQATAVNALAYAAQMRPVTPATVWHGSPHKFDRFDASKIGTGEGAQAYGHGIYVAESPDVARQYQEALSKQVSYGGRRVAETHPSDSPLETGRHAVATRVANGEDAVAAIKAEADSWREQANFYRQHAKEVPEAAIEADSFEDVARSIESLNPAEFYKNPGALYKVDLPDEKIARMLDWDKPLSQQPAAMEAARQIFDQLPELYPSVGEVLATPQLFDGKHLYQALVNHEKPSAASKTLKSTGLPGIRYLDGGSRGAGGGTSNFVIFPGEENALTILERNGVPLR